MKSPIQPILEKYMWDTWDTTTQYKIRNEIIDLGIEGIVDVKFTIMEHGSRIQVTPVFATEKDWMWYNLKYESTFTL